MEKKIESYWSGNSQAVWWKGAVNLKRKAVGNNKLTVKGE